MKLTIEGTAEEISAIVSALQDRSSGQDIGFDEIVKAVEKAQIEAVKRSGPPVLII